MLREALCAVGSTPFIPSISGASSEGSSTGPHFTRLTLNRMRVSFFEGTPFFVVVKRKPKENHHFGGPLKNRHTHLSLSKLGSLPSFSLVYLQERFSKGTFMALGARAKQRNEYTPWLSRTPKREPSEQGTQKTRGHLWESTPER